MTPDLPPVGLTHVAAQPSVRIGMGIVLLLLVVYTLSHPDRNNFYNHFVWQADAWLQGHASIAFPVAATPDHPGNDYFQDVMPILAPDGTATGRGLIPFPPLPAVVLVPFVAIFGLTTNAQFIATILGALVVGVGFWTLGRLRLSEPARIGATLFFGLGTVFWYAAMLGTTWFFAHVVAVGLTFLAIGIALDADPRALDELEEEGFGALAGAQPGHEEAGHAPDPTGADRAATDPAATVPPNPAPTGGRLAFFDARQFVAGLLFGLACTARLTVVFGAPFFVLVGGGGTWFRRSVSAGLGAAIPIGVLFAYNWAVTGAFLHPAYDYLYHLEAYSYSFLHYNPDWSIEDPRYLPQNLGLMLAGLPSVMPACPAGAARALFDSTCPIAVPDPAGMSLVLTSPGWLLGIPALRAYGRSRIVTGAAIAVLFIAAINLMHFSQGWVQFGYRFSSDFAPFALLLVAAGIEWLWPRRLLIGALIGASILVNAWGVIWAGILGW